MREAWALADERRLRALAETDLVAGIPEATFEPYARIVARLLDVPVALVSIVDDEQQYFPAQVGLGEPWASQGGTPLSMSFCQHVVRGDAPLVVTDATGDDRVAGNLAIEELDVIAYLGVPLRAPGGEPLGSLCAITNHPRAWDDAELAVLEEVAGAVAQLIAVRTTAHRWAGFAADASHRLRTPVAALRLELEDLALWPTLPADARASVEAAVTRAGELSMIVDDLAELAQAQQDLRRTEVDVVQLLGVILTAAGGTPPDGPESLVLATVPTVLQQVLTDLVASVRADGTASVRATVEPRDGHIRISLLADEGMTAPVIAPALRDRVVTRLRGRVSSTESSGAGVVLVLPA